MEAMSHICDAHLTQDIKMGNKTTKDNIFNTLRDVSVRFKYVYYILYIINKEHSQI